MDAFQALKEGFVAWRRPDLVWIRLTGKDALDWLQGQVTQDVRGVGDRDLETCLTSATGQLLAHAYLLHDEAGIQVVTSQPRPFLERLESYVVSEDVQVHLLEGEPWMLARRGPRPNAFTMFSDVGGLVLFPTLVTDGTVPAVASGDRQLPVAEVSETFVSLLEVEHGIPRFGVDTTPKTLPPELGAAFVRRTVSLDKGCYVGQEVLMRMHSRGHANRAWVGLVSDEPLDTGGEVMSGGELVGVVHRTAFSPRMGPVSTATLRAGHAEEGAVVRVGGQSATVLHFPLMRA